MYEREREKVSSRMSEGVADSAPGKATMTSRMRSGPSADAIAEAVIQRLSAPRPAAIAEPSTPAPAARASAEPSYLIAHDVAARGTAGAGSSLPFLSRIQESFGHHDVGGVSAHVGGAAQDAAASLGARAYAFGNDVAFASAPDLHTAAHEAAHVVQQRGGVHLAGGIGHDGDPHERHADAVADAVVAGGSAVALLDQYAPGGGAPQVQRLRAAGSAAASTVLFRLATARPGQLEILLGLLSPQLTATEPTFSISFELGGEHIDLVEVPHHDARVLAEAGIAQLEEDRRRAAAPGHGPDAPPQEVHVGTVAELTGILGTAIAGAGGMTGDGAELRMLAHIPFPACSVVLGLHLEIEHGGEGYRIVAEPQFGIGLPVVPGPVQEHLDALAGYRIEVQGHDSHTAAQLLVNGVEHSLNSLLAVVGGVTTDEEEVAGRAGMTEHDFVDTSLGISARGDTSSSATPTDPAMAASMEAGASQHWRAQGEDGAEQMAYQAFDFHTRAEIHGCGIEVEAHAMARAAGLLPGEHAPDSFKVKFFGTAHTDGLNAWMCSMLVTCLDLIIHAGDMAGAHGVVTAAQAAHNRAEIIGGLAADGVVNFGVHGASLGLAVELEGSSTGETEVIVRLESEAHLHVGVFDGSYEHTHEIYRHAVE